MTIFPSPGFISFGRRLAPFPGRPLAPPRDSRARLAAPRGMKQRAAKKKQTKKVRAAKRRQGGARAAADAIATSRWTPRRAADADVSPRRRPEAERSRRARAQGPGAEGAQGEALGPQGAQAEDRQARRRAQDDAQAHRGQDQAARQGRRRRRASRRRRGRFRPRVGGGGRGHGRVSRGMTSDHASHRRRAKGAEAAMRSPWDGDGAWRSNRGSRPQQRRHSAPPPASAAGAPAGRDPEAPASLAAADKCARLLAAASAFRRGDNGDAGPPRRRHRASDALEGRRVRRRPAATCADAAGRWRPCRARRRPDGATPSFEREPFVPKRFDTSDFRALLLLRRCGRGHAAASPPPRSPWRGHVSASTTCARLARTAATISASPPAGRRPPPIAAARILGDGASDPNVAVGRCRRCSRATERPRWSDRRRARVAGKTGGSLGSLGGFRGRLDPVADARLVAACCGNGADAGRDAAGDTRTTRRRRATRRRSGSCFARGRARRRRISGERRPPTRFRRGTTGRAPRGATRGSCTTSCAGGRERERSGRSA